jgi:hypothetical protein
LMNRNIDFSVFGSLISKVTPTSNYFFLIQLPETSTMFRNTAMEGNHVKTIVM